MNRSVAFLMVGLFATEGHVGHSPLSIPIPYMLPGFEIHAPAAFRAFCERSPEECQPGSTWMAEEDLDELAYVNRSVNAEIEPATDMELYGVAEYWTIPTNKGDCEDYALLKRKRLISYGWPASVLLMTIALDSEGKGHAVLTVRTSLGDLILDNKRDDIMVWHRTGYRFVERQSPVDPRIWVTVR